ncbi:MAG: potassium/proton antiporter [Methanobrevibacter woesei]|uniref:potassium/proton antiporter n=1 Tax=Methanobrevibacter woesei TaxID=190976 RepID=UPI0023F547FD|nr:potassium/proton antiporter [Methanobrevibacter woesei]MCI7290920.1 potassium/proton antiporter [Methanobrevibacter woesei]
MEHNLIFLAIGLLLIGSVFLSRFTSKIGIPTLVVFLIIGISLDTSNLISSTVHNYELVQTISIFALIMIMFSGGLDTEVKLMKPIVKPGLSLSTVGVVITAFIIGIVVHLMLGLDLMLSLLLGSIISSTDAAAVFSIFKTQNMKIKNSLDSMLELESGTNDPMAYILVISFIELITVPNLAISTLVIHFIQSLVLGVIFGFVLGKFFAKILAKIHLAVDGLYPVLLLSTAILSFSVSEFVGGNGFLAVYLAALIIGNSNIKNKESQMSFFEGFAWLMQVALFILLGVFTTPSELFSVLIPAVFISILIIFVARPIAVLISLAPFDVDVNSKAFVSWAGIKGAVPIVFAFYPLVYQIPGANLMFNIVLVTTCISVLLQGSTLKFMAKRFNLLDD